MPQKGSPWFNSPESQLLIYEEPAELGAVFFAGTDKEGSRSPQVDETPTEGNMYHSTAQLQAVASLQVFLFQGHELKFCRGMIFRYKEGWETAVGQCRVNVDPSETYLNPTGICFRHLGYDRVDQGSPAKRRVQVCVEASAETGHSPSRREDGWEHVPFDSGYALNFLFDDRDTMLQSKRI